MKALSIQNYFNPETLATSFLLYNVQVHDIELLVSLVKYQ